MFVAVSGCTYPNAWWCLVGVPLQGRLMRTRTSGAAGWGYVRRVAVQLLDTS